MKKVLLSIMTVILLVSLAGFALAASEDAPGSQGVQAVATPTLYAGQGNGTGSENGSQGTGEGSGMESGNGTQEMIQTQERVRTYFFLEFLILFYSRICSNFQFDYKFEDPRNSNPDKSGWISGQEKSWESPPGLAPLKLREGAAWGQKTIIWITNID